MLPDKLLLSQNATGQNVTCPKDLDINFLINTIIYILSNVIILECILFNCNLIVVMLKMDYLR